MKGHLKVFAFAIFLYLLLAASPSWADESQDLFDQAWLDFDRNYSYFVYKGVDWDGVKTTYRSQFLGLDGDAFAQKLNEILSQVLHDWHVAVKVPSDGWIGLSSYESYYLNYDPDNYPAKNYPRYGSGTYHELGEGVVYHGLVGRNTAYIVVTTLSTSEFNPVSDNDIHTLFTDTYKDTTGMIIDIRANNGGNENNAKKIASHLTSQYDIYGWHESRIPGEDHEDFGDLVEHDLEPYSYLSCYSNPVIFLIGKRCLSSAEWFTLMMKMLPQVTLIGDTTRGGSGNPQEFGPLSNGVSYMISTWVAYDADLNAFEDVGIDPDIKMAPADSYDGSHDYVLEKALSMLEPKIETVKPVIPAMMILLD